MPIKVVRFERKTLISKADIQATNGADIYTVSNMLTHKNVATTQIYAEVVNLKKRDTANSISLK